MPDIGGVKPRLAGCFYNPLAGIGREMFQDFMHMLGAVGGTQTGGQSRSGEGGGGGCLQGRDDL